MDGYLVRNQWIIYQNEFLPDSFYLKDDTEVPIQSTHSYWSNALERCGLEQNTKSKSRYKKIDLFWTKGT